MTSPDPRRGEIWYVDLEPTIGSEMKKTRPVVVVNSDAFRKHIPLRLVVPLTGWKPIFENKQYFVQILHSAQNGLKKDSAAAVLQLRGVALERFETTTGRIGALSQDSMEEIAAAIVAVIEYV
jgi:mRNA interferase MazF